jgi:hypothetical protein
VKRELELRKGQANDCLQGVWTHLGEKSFLFRHDLWLADSKVKKTRAWTRLMAVNKKLNQQGWVYDKAQTTMIKLGAGVSDLGKYKALTKADVAVSTAVMKPNMSGQRDAALA